MVKATMTFNNMVVLREGIAVLQPDTLLCFALTIKSLPDNKKFSWLVGCIGV